MKKASTSTNPPKRGGTLERIVNRPLTKRQRDQIAALAAMPDAQIDTTDIPEVTEESGWVRNPLYRPLTRSITIRLNAPDVAMAQAISRKKGMPYQTFIGQLLHEALKRELS